MTKLAEKPRTRAIVVEEVLPQSPETIWKVLTQPELIARWLMQNDFAPVKGRHFTMQAQPMGDWNGIVDCEVLEIDPPRKLVYSWIGGSSRNPTYGSALDSIITFTLTPVEGGTQLKLVHDGFLSPQNDAGFEAMSQGWFTIGGRVGSIAAELA